MQKNRFTLVLLILSIFGYGLFTYASVRNSRLLPNIASFSPQQAVTIAESFATSQNLIKDIGEFQSAVGFEYYKNEVAFVTANQGQQQAHDYYQKHNLPLLTYNVRFFKELEQDQAYISVDTETGSVIDFHTKLSDKTARKSLSRAQASELALAFAKTMDFDQRILEEQYYSSQKVKQRFDHHFVFKIKSTEIDSEWGKTHRQIKTSILGDRVGSFTSQILVPESFITSISIEKNNGQLLAILSALAILVMFIIATTILIRQFIATKVHWKLFGYVSISLVGVFTIDFINEAGLTIYRYNTDLSYAAFFGSEYAFALIVVMVVGIVTFVTGTAGNAIYETTWGNKAPFALEEIKANVTSSILTAYSITGLPLGLTTITYLLGEKYLDVWAMADVLPFDFLLAPVPFLSILVVPCLLAPFSEELMFRLFGISFFKKYIKSTWVAILIPTMIWALAHSDYPVFPYYFRVIELTLAGSLLGFFFFRYGIVTVIAVHYLFNALQFAPVALARGSVYVIGSEILVLLLPLLVAWLLLWRNSKPYRTRNNEQI